MKTITEIKKNFSNEEIKLLVEIVKGKQEFSLLGEQIKDFYSDEFNLEINLSDKGEEWLRENILERLEFDLEMGGII
tara:strand:- start:38 stop:268 length:231 start_codon:yes stop_codon:yes gene_type:complete